MPLIGEVVRPKTVAGEINRLHREVVAGVSTAEKHQKRLRELMKAELVHWVRERIRIHRRRRQGKPRPWTDDPILQNYRFCNVRREDDRETRWRAENWRNPHANDRDVWFAMVVGAFVPWHPTCEELGYPVPFDRERFVKVLHDRQERGEKVWSGAYRVFGTGAGSTKAEMVANTLTAFWADRRKLRLMDGGLVAAHRMLTAYSGIGSFLAAQVIADLKYTPTLAKAPDWWSWAASGPGSRRGLNRMLGRHVDCSWDEADWLRNLQQLHDELRPQLRAMKIRLHNQDLQNVLCETDKYLRVKLGEGKPRAKYDGSASANGRLTVCPACGSAECQRITDPSETA